jgi:hypothetical membrane protein
MVGLIGELNKRKYALLGILAPVVAISFITMSIILSPWFNWSINALSDLGHSVESKVAPLFNFGLLLCGFLIINYSITCFRKHAIYTSYFLMLTGLSLQLVATFDEFYGFLHFFVSVLFFLALGFSSLTYVVERRSALAFVALIIGSFSWILYGLEIFSMGIAVPEIVSSMAAATWIILSSLRIYFERN